MKYPFYIAHFIKYVVLANHPMNRGVIWNYEDCWRMAKQDVDTLWR